MKMPKTFVFTPTYNEKENIALLIKELLKYGIEILVVDDNSPDGTAGIVKELAKKHKNVGRGDRKNKRGDCGNESNSRNNCHSRRRAIGYDE